VVAQRVLHEVRAEDRDQDQQDDHDGAGQRDLVALQPHPGDLTEGASLDLLAVDTGEHRFRLRLGVGPGHLKGCGHAPYLLPSGHWFGHAAGAPTGDRGDHPPPPCPLRRVC